MCQESIWDSRVYICPEDLSLKATGVKPGMKSILVYMEETVFSPLCILASSVKDNVLIGV